MRFGSLLFSVAAVLYFSSKVFAGELPADRLLASEVHYLPSPIHPELSLYGAKAAGHLEQRLGVSLTVEEKESLAYAEKMAIRSTATASTARVQLFPTYLYCLKAGVAVGFSFEGGECVDGSGNRKSIGMIGLGGLEAQGHATVLVVYGVPGESINGLYSDAKGTSIGLFLGGSGVRFHRKSDFENQTAVPGYANLYSFGVGLGITRFAGAQMTITDAN